ncbi:MAG: VOC family protein [Acidobacteria bacterium]|nr:VOC family protein [Acidobacteriota bacterium]
MEDRYPAVIPMLCYEDCLAALAWLAKAFGFSQRQCLMEADGRVGHAEMETGGGGLFMLGSGPNGYEGPASRQKRYEGIRKWSAVPYIIDGVLVYVDDIELHYQTAKQAGAKILSPPENAPYGRLYRAEDLEGHRWMFMQRSIA